MSDDERRAQLARQFTRYMYEGVEALARLGYNAHRFRQMLDREGDAVVVARRLVMADGSDGLWRLMQMNRLDMSVEMWVLYPEYEELFDQATRDRAYAKLRGLGYDVEAQIRRHLTETT